MSTRFNSDEIVQLGWRQGAVLGPVLLRAAREAAPSGLVVADDDWLIVTSHDCDIVNRSIEKEPAIEILRAEVLRREAPDKQQIGGRNPRIVQFQVGGACGGGVVLSAKVHERWILRRELLSTEKPGRYLPDKERRLLAEWLAKRYIRSAFPTSFDIRWRKKMGDWIALLGKYGHLVRGVYLRLNTLDELAVQTPYQVRLIVAVPAEERKQTAWHTMRAEIEQAVEVFWKQFAPSILFDEVDVLGTDELTLDDIEPYQRFDADWVSFTDDTAMTPIATDMTT